MQDLIIYFLFFLGFTGLFLYTDHLANKARILKEKKQYQVLANILGCIVIVILSIGLTLVLK